VVGAGGTGLRGVAVVLANRLRRPFVASPRAIDLLWSKGTPAHCDVHGPPEYALDGTETCQPKAFFRKHYRRASGLVWVRMSGRARRGESCDLDRFVRAALPTIRKPFALVTTDGDVSVPSDLRPATVAALLDSPFLVMWLAQNYDGTPHPKLGPFPIGLDLHTPRPEGDADALAALLGDTRLRRRAPYETRPLRVFTDVNLNLNSDDRRRVVASLSDCPLVEFAAAKVSQAEIWRRYAEASFVLSVAGVGSDCHRTWEALYLGAIVIAKRSALDPLFDGLPVALVDDWGEICDAGRLAAWHTQYAPLTGQDYILRQLAPDRWLRPHREAVAATSARDGRLRRKRHRRFS
jgi:hypothetical protein